MRIPLPDSILPRCYNLGYKFRVGASLDGVYDGSANVYREDVIVEYGSSSSKREFLKPGIQYQLAWDFRDVRNM